MVHTLLSQPAIWNVTGNFKSAHLSGDKTLLVTGKTTVVRQGENILIDSSLQLENGTMLQTNYTVDSHKTPETSVPFAGTSSVLGNLRGTFTLQGNKIIEDYATENQQLTGQEIMTMHNENHYTSEGTLYQQGKVKSTWALVMTKKP